MTRGGVLQRISTAGLALALFALTFKALLPPGFMLDASGGSLAITLCDGGQAYFDPATGDIGHDAPASDDTSQHCPFAFAGPPALTAPVAAIEPAPQRAFVANAAPAREAIGANLTTGPPLPARGPPILA